MRLLFMLFYVEVHEKKKKKKTLPKTSMILISKFKQIIRKISSLQNSLHPKHDNFQDCSGEKTPE